VKGRARSGLDFCPAGSGFAECLDLLCGFGSSLRLCEKPATFHAKARSKTQGVKKKANFEFLFVSTAADDPRNHMKRHKTRAFFVPFRVASWIVLSFQLKEMGALIETDLLFERPFFDTPFTLD